MNIITSRTLYSDGFSVRRWLAGTTEHHIKWLYFLTSLCVVLFISIPVGGFVYRWMADALVGGSWLKSFLEPKILLLSQQALPLSLSNIYAFGGIIALLIILLCFGAFCDRIPSEWVLAYWRCQVGRIAQKQPSLSLEAHEAISREQECMKRWILANEKPTRITSVVRISEDDAFLAVEEGFGVQWPLSGNGWRGYSIGV